VKRCRGSARALETSACARVRAGFMRTMQGLACRRRIVPSPDFTGGAGARESGHRILARMPYFALSGCMRRRPSAALPRAGIRGAARRAFTKFDSRRDEAATRGHARVRSHPHDGIAGVAAPGARLLAPKQETYATCEVSDREGPERARVVDEFRGHIALRYRPRRARRARARRHLATRRGSRGVAKLPRDDDVLSPTTSRCVSTRRNAHGLGGGLRRWHGKAHGAARQGCGAPTTSCGTWSATPRFDRSRLAPKDLPIKAVCSTAPIRACGGFAEDMDPVEDWNLGRATRWMGRLRAGGEDHVQVPGARGALYAARRRSFRPRPTADAAERRAGCA